MQKNYEEKVRKYKKIEKINEKIMRIKNVQFIKK